VLLRPARAAAGKADKPKPELATDSAR